MVREITNLPQRLKEIPDPPLKLYVIGDEKILYEEKIISVVGSRKISSRGYKITEKITRELVKGGFVIVSGMAFGIDAVVHKTVIDNGGKTIAVLGAGVDIIYPRENTGLYNSIIQFGGAIVSEIPPGHFVPRNKFAARNRIICGLAIAVVIVEAEIKSGSMVTAKLALDQGKDVFAIPGSPGTDYLIDQGATVLKL